MSQRARLGRIERAVAVRATTSDATRPDFSRYANDPVGFAQDVLGITLWDQIAEALQALLKPPYMVSIDSGHAVGKTAGMSVALLWWYYTRDPCWIISTAPTQNDVKDVLWTQVRLFHANARIPLPDDFQPAAPEMRSGPEHVAKGYTARDANSAQGRHRRNMLFLFDEKEGVDQIFWDGMVSMFRPGAGDAALAVGNPFTTTSRAYFETKKALPDGRPKWAHRQLSCLEHPNIRAFVADGEKPIPADDLPVPSAITPEQIDVFIADWCDAVTPGDEQPTDIVWRGVRYRPGPIGEPRILGRRPSSMTDGVWSDALLDLAMRAGAVPPPNVVPTVGADVAGKGMDYTAVHTRVGPVSLKHETGNGWEEPVIADRIRATCRWAAEWFNAHRVKPDVHTPMPPEIGEKDVQINIEDDATGRGVQSLLRLTGHKVYPVNAGGHPIREELYPNRRSELWFMARDLARKGLLNLALLDQGSRQRLRQQLTVPKWQPDAKGKRVVESKDDTKKKMGRSPDDADAMNICYYTAADTKVVVIPKPPPPPAPVPHMYPGVRAWAEKRGLFGMGG